MLIVVIAKGFINSKMLNSGHSCPRSDAILMLSLVFSIDIRQIVDGLYP